MNVRLTLKPIAAVARCARIASMPPALLRPASLRLYSSGASSTSSGNNNGSGDSSSNNNAQNAAPSDAASNASDAADAHKKALEEKDKQIVQLQDSFRRALADAENVRQRTRKEIEDKQNFAIQKFAKELLSTADILAMALDSVPEAERSGSNDHLKNLYTGVSMTRAELLKTLKQFGVVPFDPIGEKFDPNLHQALFQAPVPGKEPGSIFQVTKVGYKIHERVLRPAQVGVVTDGTQ
eukprot:jgi/Hompol1/4887/HPOL_003999-RA